MNFSAVILAGGKSSRMGCDKAFWEIGGRTLLARQIERVHKLGPAEIFVSSRAGVDYSTFGCRVLQDKYPGAGPLAGIERALGAAKSPMVRCRRWICRLSTRNFWDGWRWNVPSAWAPFLASAEASNPWGQFIRKPATPTRWPVWNERFMR